MPHVRTQIRHDMRDALIAASTAAGARVYTSRTRQLQRDELPAITLRGDTEQLEVLTIGRPIAHLERDSAIVVALFVSTADDDWEDQLDALAAQAETAIASGAFNAGGAHYVYPTSYTTAEADEGESVIGVGYLTFKARYATSQLDPTQNR